MINTNIYYYADTIFSQIDIRNLVINNSDVFYYHHKNKTIYCINSYIFLDKFDLSINDEKFVSKITTKSDSKSQKFILTSNGIFDIEKLERLF